LISVIIPAFNVAPFIRQAVASALAQTRNDIEVIVVDDGSTDGTGEVLRQFSDPRLRVIRQENRGSAAARNTGLQVASGELVAFLDGDDFWAPENLAHQSAFLENHAEVDMTFGRSRVVDENGTDMGYSQFQSSGVIPFSRLLQANEAGNGSCTLLRRKSIDQAGAFDSSLEECIDLDLFLRVANQRSGNVVAIPEVLTYYRRRSGQITGDWRRMELAYLQVLRKLRRISPEEVARQERKSRASRYCYFATIARGSPRRWEPLGLLMVAFCWAPLWLLRDRRTWAGGLAVVADCVLPRALSRWLERHVQGLLRATSRRQHG
jgi:glycosyltransferase involved in cell wall biosynthesis